MKMDNLPPICHLQNREFIKVNVADNPLPYLRLTSILVTY